MDHGVYSVKKIYYKDNVNWKNEYDLRFNLPSSRHLEFFIKEVNYKEEYPAFFCYTEELAVLQNEIAAFSIKLIKLINTLPKTVTRQILQAYLFEEIEFNNLIEGIRSTRQEIEEAFNREKLPSRYVRLWGITNKYKKILANDDIPLQTCTDIRNLYTEFIHEEIIKDDPTKAPDGDLFRKELVEIVTETQRVIHKGAFPEEKIKVLMDKALEILDDKTMPRLIRIAIFHCLFGYIQPFYDGNGRMSRFITSYLLAKEIDPIIALRLSFMIKSNKSMYYDLFEETNSNKNRGDLTPFIIRSLCLILHTVKLTLKNIEKKFLLFTKWEKSLTNIFLSLELEDKILQKIYFVLLQGTIFSKMGLSIEEIASAMEKTRNTIQRRINIIPTEHISLNKTHKPYRYKLNLKSLK